MSVLARSRFASPPTPQSTSSPAFFCEATSPGTRRMTLIRHCRNPGCDSSWLRPFRSRSRPVFEGGWTCSAECTEACIRSAVWREVEFRGLMHEAHRHRIPLGLLMVERGWITSPQLRSALEAQRAHRCGRVGEWLVRQRATDEATVTRALSIQWSCPILSIDCGAPEAPANILPRLFIDALSVLPVRVAAGGVVYLGFEQRLDSVLALALERMIGLQVESGIVPSSVFRPALAEILAGKFAPVHLVEAISPLAAAHLMAKVVERTQPFESRLVRVHDFLWMRLFFSHPASGVPGSSSVRDLVCTVKKI